MNRFISWSQQDREHSFFHDYSIFLDSEKTFQPAENCFLDEPFTKTGLSALQDVTKKVPLWRDYRQMKGFEDFAKRVGVSDKLEIKEISISRNHPYKKILHEHYNAKWTHLKIDKNYTIQNIEGYLKSSTNEISRLIWSTMCRANKYVLA